MPIKYDKKKGWTVEDATPEELQNLIDIGKMMIVQGTAGSFTNQRYKEWLVATDKSVFFNA